MFSKDKLINLKQKKITNDLLISIAAQYKHEFTTTGNWDKFARENSLPVSSTYIDRFGTWKDTHKEIFGHYPNNRLKYSTESLTSIALQYKDEFTTGLNWDKFAKVHSLPSSFTYRERFGSWKDAHKEIFGYYFHEPLEYSIESLTSIALQYKNEFTSRNNWDKFARENSLPVSETYRDRFGTWKDAHKVIFGR